MTVRHAHGPARSTAVVIPLVPRAEADTTAEAGTGSFIAELATATAHLEKALGLSQTPAQFQLPDGATVTAAQLCLWVAQHTARAQTLLDRLTASYPDQQI
ncbi:hypothetical protein [Streptomyces griseorubiginosus]|uniref:hypothetical protein n=1 Tax=Streptomyces griseorubiginosus TaxID=67304 RepID=UPI0036E85E57